jgi:alpha-glucosidase
MIDKKPTPVPPTETKIILPNTETKVTLPPVVPPPQPKEINFKDANISTRYEDVFQIVEPDEVIEVLWQEGAYQFNCKNKVAMRVSVVSGGIIRLRYSATGRFERDFSYALDPDFRPEKVVVMLHENTGEYLLVSEQLQVVVQKSGMKVKFYDADDRTICEDDAGFSAKRTIMQGWNEARMSKKCHKKEVFLGLGDKTCGTNLRGKKFQNWNSDSFAFGRDTDPLYRSIPFYYALNQGLAYGIFFDNTYKSHFDFGLENKESTQFWAEGGELNYYFIYGPTLLQVAQSYAMLTGTPELPAHWTLGYHQCRWSYYPEKNVRDIANNFRSQEIPCDAIYLDIDYMDKFRCFTWNNSFFPDPKQLIADLKDQGFQTVVMINPGVKEDDDYFLYQEGLEKDFFIKTMDGQVAKGPVWPGFCAFPDFTNPEVRDWWGLLYKELYLDQNVAGFWNDMNEPAVFHVHHKTLPDNVLHDFDGELCSHKKAHNIYGQQMSRSSQEGFKALQPNKRPFLLVRASYAGGQRFASVWTGDNCADWEHLQIANVQCQRLSISGFSFCGTDIGGFAGNPDGELYVRWLQLAVFHPLMRTHSMGFHATGDSIETDASEVEPEIDENLMADQEPWSYGEKWTPFAKKAIELRYAIFPYIYTAIWRNSVDGIPVMRPLLFEDQNDVKLSEIERDFMFGPHILVSPVVQPRIQRQGVYLPKGNWYYFWTGQQFAGETFITMGMDQIPFFVREGAVLPVYPVMQYTNEKPIDELTLYIYFKKGEETSELYEDRGEGYQHENGDFSLKTFITVGSSTHFELHQHQQGNFKVAYKTVKIFLVGIPFFAKKCDFDGQDMPIKEIRLRDRSLYTMTVTPDFQTISWSSE